MLAHLRLQILVLYRETTAAETQLSGTAGCQKPVSDGCGSHLVRQLLLVCGQGYLPLNAAGWQLREQHWVGQVRGIPPHAQMAPVTTTEVSLQCQLAGALVSHQLHRSCAQTVGVLHGQGYLGQAQQLVCKSCAQIAGVRL